MSATRLAYIAGFVDGEGSIFATHEKSGASYPRIQVSNTIREPLQLIVDTFGGRIHIQKQRGNRKLCYAWTLCGGATSVVLGKLMPYFIVKKHLAALAIALTFVPKTQQYKIADEMDRLNKRGRG